MYRSEPTAGIGDGTVATVTRVVSTVLAVVAGGDAVARAEPAGSVPSPARPPAATTTGLGGASA